MLPLRALGVLLFLSCSSVAQLADRDRRWIEDADYLAQQIVAIHPSPFLTHSREAFGAELETLKAEIPRLRDYEVAARLAKLAAMAGDAHTSLNVMSGGARGAGVQARWFSDGLWIIGGGPATAQYIGRRVVAVNGVPIEEVFGRLKPYLSHENESWARQISSAPILSPEVLAVTQVMSEPANVPVTLEDRLGQRTEALLPVGGAVNIQGPHLARPLNPLWRRNTTLYYWMHYLEDRATLYVKYNVCAESPALRMAEFSRQLAELAVEKQPARYVFDLRDNTGGDSSWLGVMLRDVQAAGEAGRLRLPTEGFYVIISKTTFSSGTLGAMELRRIGGITVGEPSGGNPTGFGPTVAVVLPNSRLTASVSRGWVQTQGWGQTPVPAEIPVEFPADAFFTDQDPYLEAALKAVPPVSAQGAVQSENARGIGAWVLRGGVRLQAAND